MHGARTDKKQDFQESGIMMLIREGVSLNNNNVCTRKLLDCLLCGAAEVIPGLGVKNKPR